MGTSGPDLFFAFDRSRPRGLRVQIEDGLRSAIRSGRLAAGSPVPSTRALAADLGITRKVVVEAYDQLIAEGYLLSRQGAGTVVQRVPAVAQAVESAAATPAVEVDFRPGRPDLTLFPRAAWAKAARSALRSMPTADFADEDPRGLPVLRQALVDYLGRVRGVSADPAQVIVCAGFGHGFDLAVHALGARRYALEDPGYPGPRGHLASLGIPFDAVPVDGDGLMVSRLRETAATVAVVTPAHQSPTGVVLPPDRRRELIEWARDVDGYVIEDDYDAEYRYDRRPVGTLQGVAPERVVYCGTTSKTLGSGVRLGWLVVPPELVDPITAARRDGSTSTILQATFAELLTCGDFDRHLRRTRLVYRERRDALVGAVARWLPGVVPSGISAGLNMLLTLPGDESVLVDAAMERGVRVYPLADFSSESERAGIVLGYGALPLGKALRGARLLGAAMG
ncbi:PLP-dependent aminotransferase family protein [Actinokineospora sp. HUAS TT18]|uniref:MocR-like pyridoxine biosynthesis transcription factor PdxR n=1 Tax=Actinokineospora sp. HUAS TT18 TaxID=3447451 RepID=UPI003F51E07E